MAGVMEKIHAIIDLGCEADVEHSHQLMITYDNFCQWS